MTRWQRWSALALAGTLLLLGLQGRAALLRLGAWPGLGWLARPPEFGAPPLAESSDPLGRRFAVHALREQQGGVTLYASLSGAGVGGLGTPEIRLGVALPGGGAPGGASLSAPGALQAEQRADRWLARARWPAILADQTQVFALARLGSATWQVTVPVPRPAPRSFWLGRRTQAGDAALSVDQVVLAADYTAVYYRYIPDPVGRVPVGPFLTAGATAVARQPQRLSPPGEVVFDPLPAGARSASLSLRLGSAAQHLDIAMGGPLPVAVPAWGGVRGGGVLFERRDPAEYAVQMEVILAPGARLTGWELLPAGGGHIAPAATREETLPIAAGDLHRLHLTFPAGVGAQRLTLRTQVELPPTSLVVSFDLP